MLAPAHADFDNPAQLHHPATQAALAAFLAETGPWDVIHYQNLEGLPASVLALAPTLPATRQIVSLHNYYPFCPQVNLWRNESHSCSDYEGGAACVRCLPQMPDRRMVRAAYALEWQAARLGAGPGSALFDRAIRPAVVLGWRGWKRLRGRPSGPGPAPLPVPSPATAATATATSAAIDPASAAGFARRRAGMVGLLNAHCHRVLCVSDRVRQIALGFGLDPARTVTCPIGTDQAEAWARTAPRPAFPGPGQPLRLAYLGYMRRDKGFPWLLEALAALPDAQVARLHLTVAARRGDPEVMAAMAALAPRLAGLVHHDGYTRQGLDGLLADVDLGLVPVLWEDNLPQVAIEMHARHIPLLCSDRGGARELGRCPALVFRAGDTADFAGALDRVLDRRITPAEAFRHAMPPVDPETHLAALLGHYAA